MSSEGRVSIYRLLGRHLVHVLEFRELECTLLVVTQELLLDGRHSLVELLGVGEGGGLL